MSERVKRCTKCNEVKAESEFYASPSGRDGLASRCKKCVYEYTCEYRKTPAGKAMRLRSDRRYKKKHAEQIRERARGYKNPNAKHHKRKKGYWRIQRIRHPKKVKARDAVNRAVKFGRMVRIGTQKCAHCGKPARCYHHHAGYDKENWLDVIPLCAMCHSAAHRRS